MDYVSRSFYISKENADYIDEQAKKKGIKKYNKSNWLDDLVDHLRTKAESKSQPKPPSTQMQYPIELNVSAWEEWKAYRKENKLKAYKPTPRSEGAAVNNLIKLSKGDYQTQMLIVQQSIANGYQGLFEVKGNDSTRQANANQNRRLSATEQANQRLLEQYGDASARDEWPSTSITGSGMDQYQVHGSLPEQVGQSGITIDMEAGDFDSND